MGEMSFNSILQSLLEEYENNSGVDIGAMLESKLVELGLSSDCLNEIKEAIECIDLFDSNAVQLAEAKACGKTRSEWLSSKIESSVSGLPEGSVQPIVEALSAKVDEIVKGIETQEI